MAIENNLTDVPESEVDETVAQFEAEGCDVKKEKQPNGKWTIIAIKPDEGANGGEPGGGGIEGGTRGAQ